MKKKEVCMKFKPIIKIIIFSSMGVFCFFGRTVKDLIEGMPWYSLSPRLGIMLFEILFIIFPLIIIGGSCALLVWGHFGKKPSLLKEKNLFRSILQKTYFLWLIKALLLGIISIAITISPLILYTKLTRGYMEKVRKEKNYSHTVEWDEYKNKWKHTKKDNTGFHDVYYAQYPPGTAIAPIMPPEVSIGPKGYVMAK